MKINKDEIKQLEITIQVLSKEIDRVIDDMHKTYNIYDLDALDDFVWTRWHLANKLSRMKEEMKNNGTTNNFIEL